MKNQPVTLIRDCSATIIPAGDEVVLPEGGSFVVAQALGGSVTLRDATGMFRVGNENLDALGEDIKAAVDAENESEESDVPFDQERVWGALRGFFDPEIPVNIYELGLIYDIGVDQKGLAVIQMTLTAPGCPAAVSLPAEVQGKVKSIDGVNDARVDLVWEPPWDKDRMSEAAKLQLGIFD